MKEKIEGAIEAALEKLKAAIEAGEHQVAYNLTAVIGQLHDLLGKL